jgi:hypothetical protein
VRFTYAAISFRESSRSWSPWARGVAKERCFLAGRLKRDASLSESLAGANEPAAIVDLFCSFEGSAAERERLGRHSLQQDRTRRHHPFSRATALPKVKVQVEFQRSQRILREVFESIAYSNAISLTSQFVRGDVVPAGTIFILPGIKDWKSALPFSLSSKTASFV